ncbi:MAG: hypothetical protein Greene041619_289 [Candidatus Peregrinibacteria bacterium Greene0416_19]|nr:MAG: hypothetical protein Greene041619_289 [Candidatus Peregrinibacteria bacterium Greene0416_19]
MKKKPVAKKKPLRSKKVRKIIAKKKVMAKKPAVKKKMKVMTVSKKKAVSASAKKVTEKLLGKVVHYYDRIGVAIVDLQAPLKLGDIVQLKRGERVLTQPVTSMQIEHQPVAMAKKGDVIGLKIDEEMPSGTKVMPV